MKVRIRYYGKLVEIAECDEEEIILDSAGTFSGLEKTLINRYPAFGKVPLVFFAGTRKCDDNQMLAEGMVIECMPPFSGG